MKHEEYKVVLEIDAQVTMSILAFSAPHAEAQARLEIARGGWSLAPLEDSRALRTKSVERVSEIQPPAPSASTIEEYLW